jgi:hypothetical protein
VTTAHLRGRNVKQGPSGRAAWGVRMLCGARVALHAPDLELYRCIAPKGSLNPKSFCKNASLQLDSCIPFRISSAKPTEPSSYEDLREICHRTYQRPALVLRSKRPSPTGARRLEILHEQNVGGKSKGPRPVKSPATIPGASKGPLGFLRRKDPVSRRCQYAAKAHTVLRGPAIPCRIYQKTAIRFLRK